jgi:hypothetical protein
MVGRVVPTMSGAERLLRKLARRLLGILVLRRSNWVRFVIHAASD